MKVIIANYRYYVLGGPEIYLFKLMDLLKNNNIDAIPFSVHNKLNVSTPFEVYFANGRSNDDEGKFSNIKLSSSNIMRLVSGAFYQLEVEKKLRILIRREKPDVIFVLQQYNILSPSIFFAAKKENVRLIHRISDFNMMCPRFDFLCNNGICTKCIKGKYFNAIKYKCVKNSFYVTLIRVLSMYFHKMIRAYDLIDLFAAPAKFTADLLIDSGIKPERIVHLPTFIDCETIEPCYENRGYFLYLGRLSPEKGPDLIVDALSIIKDKNSRVVFTGSLDNDYAKDLLLTVEENGLQNRTQFVNFCKGNELLDLIKGAICIICPSIWFDNMPNVILESYAYGKPVVASDVGSLSEIIEDGQTGYLFPMKDVEALSDKLQKFLDKPDLAAQMGMKAREKCENEYSASKHLAALTEIFDKNFGK